MFVVKSKSSGLIVARLSSVEEALIADAAGHLRVDAVGYDAVLELAAARVESSPDYNRLPDRSERYATYVSKAGRQMIVEIVRLTHPDAEGYAQLAEVVNPSRPDGSFMVQASALKVIDLDSLSPALANALLQPNTYDQDGGGNAPKLTKGLKRAEA
jgi:hypothetical protein